MARISMHPTVINRPTIQSPPAEVATAPTPEAPLQIPALTTAQWTDFPSSQTSTRPITTRLLVMPTDHILLSHQLTTVSKLSGKARMDGHKYHTEGMRISTMAIAIIQLRTHRCHHPNRLVQRRPSSSTPQPFMTPDLHHQSGKVG